jgi:dipeptidyl aminopeptidase/acylaminoacyl peptidase
MITGMAMAQGDRAEHLPYVHAGYAVVSFDISGPRPDSDSDEAATTAIMAFLAARLGVQDGVAALDQALRLLPNIDPQRLFLAGHSSAATLVLQIAAEEPRVAGVAAFAPVSNVRAFLYENLGLGRSGMTAAVAKQSPDAIVDKIKLPVLLFHATGDEAVPVEQSRALAQALRQLGRSPSYHELEGGDHYLSMLKHGIPLALQWFPTLHGGAKAPASR